MYLYHLESRQASTYTYTRPRIYVYVTVASAMFGFVVDDITRTRYLRKPSASASPFAYDLKYQNSASA